MVERTRRRKSGATTIFDVAEQAGVSRMTVSRVINGDAAVRAKTRKRVEDAIAALKFEPSPAARALAGRGHVRVALLHRFPNPGYMGQFLASLLEEAGKVHASLLVRKVRDLSEDEPVVRDLAQDGVQAVILASPLSDDAKLVDLLIDQGMTVVATGSARREMAIPSVGIDDGRAARCVTEYLIGLGHRRIGFIKGNATYASTDIRLAGYRGALEAAGLDAPGELIVDGDYTYQSGLAAAEHLLGLHDPPTAIFASNDDMAAAVVSVAHRNAVNVPEDLSVCGFDDTTLATTIWPNLTTIRQPTADITRIAIEMIMRELGRKDQGDLEPPEHVRLDHLLIERESVSAPYFAVTTRREAIADRRDEVRPEIG